MINKFFFIDECNNYLQVFFGYKKLVYPITEILQDGSFKSEVLPCKQTKVMWNDDIIISSNDFLFGYPSSDKKFAIIIYKGQSKEFLPPSNAVIYNADGGLHKVLTVPKLISKLAKEKAKSITYDPQIPNVVMFDTVMWDKNSQGDIVTVVRILFDMYCFEERELNPETGEFGECINSGML